MTEPQPHPDPMVEAGRRWMNGILSSKEYFAMVRRQARRSVRRPRRRWWNLLRM